ncbi:MAG: ABC transporter substrate-binding protein [Acidimicrobiales bacterium]|nr:ABC transporter substrate-binding protein [Acidimicrobiales bacterium]
MTRSRRWCAAWCLVGLIGVLTAGCGADDDPEPVPVDIPSDLTQEPDGEPVTGGVLDYGLSVDVDSLDPRATRWTTQSAIVALSLFDPLAAYDDREEPRPYLAESFEVDEAFTEWTITVRDGVRFHDGTPLDAAAVARSLTAMWESPVAGTALGPVASIDAPDPRSVVVTMSVPWSTFPHALTGQAGLVLAPAMLDDPDGADHPIGTGPFVFEQRALGVDITTSRNEAYWRDGLPYLDAVRFRVLADPGARDAALRSGDVEILETDDPAQMQAVTEAITAQAEEGVEAELQLFTEEDYETPELVVALNVTQAPFDDPIAREAVAHAIDTQGISDVAFDGVYPPADGPFGEGSPSYVELAWPPYDVEEAARLNEEYRLVHGVPVSFTLLVADEPGATGAAQELRRQLAEADMAVQIEVIDPLAVTDRVLTGAYQASALRLFGALHLDRDYELLAGEAVPAPGVSANVTRNDNPELRAAMDEARGTDDVVEQIEQYKLAQAELATDLDLLFLVRLMGATVYTAQVHGVRDHVLPDGTSAMPSLHTFTASVWIDLG